MDDRINEVYHGKLMCEETQDILRKRVHWMCSQTTGKRILDIGCSQGTVSILLAREGKEVVGVDIDPESIDYAKSELQEESPSLRGRVSFICSDIFALSADIGEFDNVIIGQVIEHHIQPHLVLEKSISLLDFDDA